MTAKKNTIVAEAEKLLERKLHDEKVVRAARVINRLRYLEVEYLHGKKRLEEELKEVEGMTSVKIDEGSCFVSSSCSNEVRNW